jgi:rhodanese-related sulfurtransferase
VCRRNQCNYTRPVGGGWRSSQSKVIALPELRAKLDAGEELVLVEALGPQYYEAAHLPGAINVPHTQVEALAPAHAAGSRRADRRLLLRRHVPELGHRVPRG